MNSEIDDCCEARCMVQALQVSFGYKERQVAHQVSYCWHAGLCLLQGDEGAGKTSWLKALAGQLHLSGGVLHYPFATDGNLPASSLFWQDPRQPLSEAHSQKTAESWAALQSTIYPHWSAQEFDKHVRGFELEAHLGKQLLALSSGTLRKLWMAAGWASNAELVLIDEPLAALDKASARYVQQALAQMADSLKSADRPRCIIVTHWDAMHGIDWDDVLALAPR